MCELIVSRYVAESITTDCRTFWPRRPLSTAYKPVHELTKAYTAKTSCNVAMSLYDIRNARMEKCRNTMETLPVSTTVNMRTTLELKSCTWSNAGTPELATSYSHTVSRRPVHTDDRTAHALLKRNLTELGDVEGGHVVLLAPVQGGGRLSPVPDESIRFWSNIRRHCPSEVSQFDRPHLPLC